MAADQTIIQAELTAPASHGINGVTRTYNNPGGASRDDNIAAIEENTNLFVIKDIEVYRQQIQPEEVFTVWTATALGDLVQQERADYDAFIVPMLINGAIQQPDILLKDLINDVVFTGNTGGRPALRINYEQLIRELQSVDFILNAGGVTASDIEQAMFALGWIT